MPSSTPDFGENISRVLGLSDAPPTPKPEASPVPQHMDSGVTTCPPLVSPSRSHSEVGAHTCLVGLHRDPELGLTRTPLILCPC